MNFSLEIIAMLSLMLSKLKDFFRKYEFARDIHRDTFYLWNYCMTKISPALFCKLIYWNMFRDNLDLDNPKSLNEKSIWLKLNPYRNNDLIRKCTDKYRVREYIIECGCGKLLNELYAVWNSVDDIEWEKLPDRFVLKCNHTSGDVVICRDKNSFDISKSKKILRRGMHRDYSVYLAELMYEGIPRKIICEKYLDATPFLIPRDYKIFCFHGIPHYIMYCTGREQGHAKYYFFDFDWKMLNITYDSQKLGEDWNFFNDQKPLCLAEMREYAKRLSKPFPFVRVDFYEISGKIIFGELTFANTGGFDNYILLPEYNLKMGELLDLNKLDV